MTEVPTHPPPITPAAWNQMANYFNALVAMGLDWEQIFSYITGLTASGIVATPCTYMVRKNGVYFEALDSMGHLVYGGAPTEENPIGAGGVNGLDFVAVMHAVRDAAPAAKTIKLGYGTFEYSSDLIINSPHIKIKGEGKEVTFLKYTGTGSALTYYSGSPTFRFESCGLEDLTVWTTGGNAIGVTLTNNWYFHASNFLIRGSGQAAAGLLVEVLGQGVSNFNYFDQFEILDCKIGIKLRQRDPISPAGNNDMVFSSGWIWITDEYLEVQKAEGTIGVDESENWHEGLGLTANNVFVGVKVQQFEKGFLLKSWGSKMYGCSTENCLYHIILDGNFEEVYGHIFFRFEGDTDLVINGDQCVFMNYDKMFLDTGQYELNTPITFKTGTAASKAGAATGIAIGHDENDYMIINVPANKYVIFRKAGEFTFSINNDGCLQIHTIGKGIKLWNDAGTIMKHMRLNNTGDGLLFE